MRRAVIESSRENSSPIWVKKWSLHGHRIDDIVSTEQIVRVCFNLFVLRINIVHNRRIMYVYYVLGTL